MASTAAAAAPAAAADHEPTVATETTPVKAALTPPTSEEFNDKRNDSPELSDLNMDSDADDDDEDIEPSFYYEGGRIPVFEPTMDQFRHFDKFIDRINSHGMKSGICKVIPPKEWRDSLKALDDAVKTIKVKNPITQEFSGTPGIYTQANIEKQRSYNLPQWKSLCEESQHQPPARRGERRKNTEKQPRPAAKPKAVQPASGVDDGEPAAKRRRGRPPKRGGAGKKTQKSAIKEEEDADLSADDAATVTVADPGGAKATNSATANPINAPPTPTSPNTDARDSPAPASTPAPAPPAKAKKASYPRSKGGSQAKSISERRKYNQQETNTDDIDEAAFAGFDYRFYGNGEFTAERCQELESLYWKSLTFAPPMYGADMPGSLFDDDVTSWNVAHLPNLLDVLGQKVPGVNTAYLYLGMWKATFSWHLEDVDLYSINYIHFGAPKQWYSISQEDVRKFENAMKSIWPNDAKNCSQFLRHKTYMVSPSLLKSQFNIEVNRLVHYEGEFVITFPYGYHSGFNLGYNCAESVNFAQESWLDFGKLAKKCDCEADSVWVDPYYIERKWKGEPSPEYYEETDDELDDVPGDLPSPPASVVAPKSRGRKRKRDSKAAEQPPRKVRRIRLRIKQSRYEPCILCPNDMPWEKLLQTDSGRYAHEVCALYTPELYLWPEHATPEEPQKICGISQIPKSRWDLKCSYCRTKKGTKFQCSAKKCTRAFHATCAAAAGVLVDSGLTSMFTADGEFYYEEDYFRCRFHRPKRTKAMTGDFLERDPLILNAMKRAKPKDVLQMQHPQGDVFAGVVVENRPRERTVVVDVLPEGDRIEVEWKWVLVNNPDDFPLLKPSADAKPLPKDVDRVALQNSNTEHALPCEGTPFGGADEPWKWSEFSLGPRPRNDQQVKVKLEQPNQLWHFVGEKSTEARSSFTEDPARRWNNPKSVFLDLVRPPPAAPVQPFVTPQTPGSAANLAAGPSGFLTNNGMAGPRQLMAQPASTLGTRPYVYKPKNMPPGSGSFAQSNPNARPPAPYRLPDSAGIYPAAQPSAHPSTSQPMNAPDVHAATAAKKVPVPHDWRNNYKLDQPTCTTPASVPHSPTATRKESVAAAAEPMPDSPRLRRIKAYPYLCTALMRRPSGPYQSPYQSDGQYSDEYTRFITPQEAPLLPNPYVPVVRQGDEHSMASPTLYAKQPALTNQRGDPCSASFSLNHSSMTGKDAGRKSNAPSSQSNLLAHDPTFDGIMKDIEEYAGNLGAPMASDRER